MAIAMCVLTLASEEPSRLQACLLNKSVEGTVAVQSRHLLASEG